MNIASRNNQSTNKGVLINLLRKNWMVLGLLIALTTFAYASVELVFTAIESQPDCVPHIKSNNNDTSSHIAAKSSC